MVLWELAVIRERQEREPWQAKGNRFLARRVDRHRRFPARVYPDVAVAGSHVGNRLKMAPLARLERAAFDVGNRRSIR